MVKEMVQVLFPATKNIDEVVGIIEKYRMKFGLDTGMRLAQFLAQVREEVGPEFKVMRESLNYSEEALTKLYKAFNEKLADTYGRNAEHKANQEAIANIAYANKLGNGNADSDGDGDMDADDDGYKYRGAGCLQITGKGNFAEVQKRCLKYAGKEMDPDTLEGFIVFGMAFWIQHDLYNQADTGNTDRVTAVINKYTDSYERRKGHYKSIAHLVK
jgi:putative chitinase